MRRQNTHDAIAMRIAQHEIRSPLCSDPLSVHVTIQGQCCKSPDEVKICKGDSVTWVNNKGGPHNVVFDEEAIPSGVSQESISMDDQLGDEGATFTKKFDVAGAYSYYCEPHRGAGMQASLTVE